MTNSEQTLRERLAADGFPDEDDELGTAVLIDIDTALSVFSEWLESEAPEALRKSASEWSTNVAPDKLPYWKHLSRALTQSLGGGPPKEAEFIPSGRSWER